MWRKRVAGWLLRKRPGVMGEGLDLTALESHQADVDPLAMCQRDLAAVEKSIQDAVRAESSPVLDRAAGYYSTLRRDHFRAVAVLMVGRVATGGCNRGMERQRSLAEVVELLHIASELHDEIVDSGADAGPQRGTSLNGMLGNSLSLLAGDFLIARSVTLLANMENCKIVEAMANVVEATVHGQVLHRESPNSTELFEDYLSKSQLRTATLLGNAASSAMVLEGRTGADAAAARLYGDHLGMAYRLARDARSVEAFISRPRTAEEIVRQLAGSAPGPVLHTADTNREFREALVRRFSAENDDPFAALELIRTSGGLERTAGLALEHAQQAIDAATELAGAGPLRSGMINLVDHVLKSGS